MPGAAPVSPKMVSDPRPTLFLSDLHLSPDRPAAVAAFHAFAVGPARDAAGVYVLGDLFDWWVGDDQMRSRFAAAIVASLAGVAKSGVPVFVGRGNRDFLLGERFARASGATMLADFTAVDLHGVRTLLCHGDELCTDDTEYQAYRARMRAPETQARLLAMPYLVRLGIAWWLRRRSGRENALKPEAIMDVAEGAVVAALRGNEAQRLIHGHTHRPARHEHDVDGTRRERYVLADWHDRGHYLAVAADGVHAREIGG